MGHEVECEGFAGTLDEALALCAGVRRVVHYRGRLLVPSLGRADFVARVAESFIPSRIEVPGFRKALAGLVMLESFHIAWYRRGPAPSREARASFLNVDTFARAIGVRLEGSETCESR